MLKKIILTFIFVVSGVSHAEDREAGFFDLLIEPYLSIGGWGKYNMGEGISTVDEGSFSLLSLGGRVSFKVGNFLMGFDYLTGEPGADSDRQVSATTRETYPLMDSGKMTSLGVTFGVTFANAYLWYTLSTDNIEQSLDTPESYTHEYSGTGQRVSLMFRIFKDIHAGLYYHERTFDKYTSTITTGTVNNADLGNDLKIRTYGISVSYQFPISRMSDVAKAFQN